MKVELDSSNYVTKANLKNAAGIDTLDFAKKPDLANLKSDVDKLDIDKLKNVPTNLSNLKSKVDKLDVDKFVPVPVDLSKLSNEVKNDVVEKTKYKALVKKINNINTTSISDLTRKTDYNTKIN